jgi:hypothetical protein
MFEAKPVMLVQPLTSFGCAVGRLRTAFGVVAGQLPGGTIALHGRGFSEIKHRSQYGHGALP